MLLYNVLRHSDLSCVLNENSVDAAINNLTAIVREAVNLTIPYVRPKNSAFLLWFSKLLICYIQKKNQRFRKYKKSKFDNHYSAFTYYRKLVKTTIKTDRLLWVQSVEDNLKTSPKDFWKYVSRFKKNELSQLKNSQKVITEPRRIVEAFADHFLPFLPLHLLSLFQKKRSIFYMGFFKCSSHVRL
jgi:hypothetical protein